MALAKRHWKKQQKFQKIVMIGALSVALTIFLVSGAWYVIRSKREVQSKETDVIVPYYLYLLNAGDEQSLNFSVGNLHPGETKEMVICVSNKNPNGLDAGFDISRTSSFLYQLELAYTTNLPITYDVYELTLVDNDAAVEEDKAVYVYDTNKVKIKTLTNEKNKMVQTTPDIASDRRIEVFGSGYEDMDIVNVGEYDLYEVDADGVNKLELSTDVSGTTVNYEMDYYLIRISWNSGITFSDYTKETDLVEIIVKALQPRPEEK